MKNIFKQRVDIDTLVKRLFNRFPYTFVLLVFEFLGLCYMVNQDSYTKSTFIIQIVMMGGFCAIMGSITLQLLSERVSFKPMLKVALNLGLLLVIALLTTLFMYKDVQSYSALREAFTGNLYRQLILMLVSFLTIFFVPFYKDVDSKEWWNFLLTSFNRALISTMYAVVVFIGLALALAAFDTFWEIELLGSHQYEMVWFFAAVIVAPLHFLNGVYKFSTSSQLHDLPRFLLIFAKFILTPLIIIYTVILYPYIFSFPFRSEWPANEATGYILALLVLGFTGIVLFYGISEQDKEKKFAKLYTKVFTAIALPPILFWAYSLYLRIDAYKLTVNRFALMAIIIWFFGITLYYLTQKLTNAKYVLGSFLTLLVVLFYFPFSAFYWSERAQISRLYNLYQDNDLIEDGLMVRGQKASSTLNDSIGESVVYLNKFHSLRNLKPKLSSELITKLKIDDNGYANNLDYWYGSTSKIFFAEIELEVGSIDRDEFFEVLLVQEDIMIPSGYKNVTYVTIYSDPDDQVTLNNEEIVWNHKLTDPKLSAENCDVGVDMIQKHYYENAICTSDIDFMSIQLDQGMLIIKQASVKQSSDNELTLTNVIGYLFTK